MTKQDYKVADMSLAEWGRKEIQIAETDYVKTAAYGHFGRNEVEFSWERTDKAQLLKESH